MQQLIELLKKHGEFVKVYFSLETLNSMVNIQNKFTAKIN